MNWLIDNWSLIVAAVAVIACAAGAVIGFKRLPKEEQIKNVKEWLKWAVTEAERELGSGTGQLKLRRVYDMAIAQFPWIAEIVTFATFSVWVDDALIWLNKQLESNNAIITRVKGE